MTPSGMLSLAVAFPSRIRTNDQLRRQHPALFERSSQHGLARLWDPGQSSDASRIFDEEMSRYSGDPFRGAVERRVLGPGETARDFEVQAARAALAAARLGPEDVDLMMVSSFMPDQLAVGNAALLARDLGLRGAAWNFETACSSSVVGLHTAGHLVRSGAYRRILVVVSCTYSRDADETDTLSWFLGDGAGAFVVGDAGAGATLLGDATVHTADTCGAFAHLLELGQDGKPVIRMRAGEGTGRVLRDTSDRYLRECCGRALDRAGVALGDVALLVTNTPTAWFAAFAARTLGIPRERTVDTYPRYANIGPALMPANLHYAARTGRLARGDLVLLYAVGSVSTASAAVLRWGEVALG